MSMRKLKLVGVFAVVWFCYLFTTVSLILAAGHGLGGEAFVIGVCIWLASGWVAGWTSADVAWAWWHPPGD